MIHYASLEYGNVQTIDESAGSLCIISHLKMSFKLLLVVNKEPLQPKKRRPIQVKREKSPLKAGKIFIM